MTLSTVQSSALIDSLGFVWRDVFECHFLYLSSTALNTVYRATARTRDPSLYS